MASKIDQFRRKLSAEEVKGRFVTVQRRDLDFFPKLGKSFEMKIANESLQSHVKAVECWCQGPKKPHSHYRIDLTPFLKHVQLRWGTKLVIEKASEKEYSLVV